jgi:LmbE family N-acetylglucosaminyl deacetylase
VRWSLGAVEQVKAEREVAAERRVELSESHDELGVRAERFLRLLHSARTSLEAERVVLMDRMAQLRDRVARLPEREEFRHFREVAELDLVDLDARLAFVEALIASRRSILEGAG